MKLPNGYVVEKSPHTGRCQILGGGNVCRTDSGEVLGPRVLASWSVSSEMPRGVGKLVELDQMSREHTGRVREMALSEMARIYRGTA